jgi:hypothetical protein
MGGWQRSADRTRLQANSLLTGNLTGKFTALRAGMPNAALKRTALQSFSGIFPALVNRENHSTIREIFPAYQGFFIPTKDSSNGHQP